MQPAECHANVTQHCCSRSALDCHDELARSEVTTDYLHFDIAGHQYDGAIMITASHLPFHRNGFKFFTAEGGAEKVLRTCINDTCKFALYCLDKHISLFTRCLEFCLCAQPGSADYVVILQKLWWAIFVLLVHRQTLLLCLREQQRRQWPLVCHQQMSRQWQQMCCRRRCVPSRRSLARCGLVSWHQGLHSAAAARFGTVCCGAGRKLHTRTL